MYRQTRRIGIADKLIIGFMTLVLFVTGFFAGLLVLAIVGAMVIFVLGKAWWLRRHNEKRYIEGKYRVVPE